jgi:hypothetical protein
LDVFFPARRCPIEPLFIPVRIAGTAQALLLAAISESRCGENLAYHRDLRRLDPIADITCSLFFFGAGAIGVKL